MQALIGQMMGQYNLVEQIGAGGMATIFKAHQPSLNRDVAVKILSPHLAQNADFTERFTREAQAIGRLNHPNILPVFDYGQDKVYSYLVMRYVPGAVTLADRMKSTLTQAKIVEIISRIADALDHAHQAGIIHRDIKPTNILMDGDWVLLSDFGLAKLIETPSGLTATGVGMGTPAYMSPEQGMGEKVDHRSDIYSLGIILYEMLTGQIPHQGETPIATVMKRITDPLPPPGSIKPAIPKAVEAVLLKALDPEPSRRFASAGELARALKEAIEKPQPTPSMPPSKPAAKSVDVAMPPKETLTAKRSALEWSAFFALGAISLCSAMLAIVGVFSAEGASELGNVFLGLGPLIAGISSMVLLWFRPKAKPASAALAMSILLWFFGVNFLGFGAFAATIPGDTPVMENLGFSVALCGLPGLFFVLGGLGLYLRELNRNRVQGSSATNLASGKEHQIDQSRLQKLRRAGEYAIHIKRRIKQNKAGVLSQSMGDLANRVENWEARLRQLVDRLNTFEANRIIQRDLEDTPAAIVRMKAQLEAETDPQLRAQMADTLAEYQTQLRHLKALVRLMRRTDLEIDESLASIGSIYSQLQLLEAKDIDSGRAERLSGDIDEQANRLGDLLSAMDEVYRDRNNLAV